MFFGPSLLLNIHNSHSDKIYRMKPNITIRCAPEELEHVLQPLEKLKTSLIAYHSVQPARPKKSTNFQKQILVYVLGNDEEVLELDFDAYHRVFVIAPKMNDFSLFEDLRIAMKTSLLTYNENPKNALLASIVQIESDFFIMKKRQEYVTKSLCATLLHEINNPLTIAMGFTNGLTKKNANIPDKAKKIASSLERIKVVVKDKLPLYLDECFTSKKIKKEYDYLE